jgi:cytochrome c peroxidase
MLTLVSANSKYDSVMQHKATFTVKESNGYGLYKAHCASCHQEPLFTNNDFENNGLLQDPSLKDIGRMAITHSKKDSLKFKTPTLRNVAYTFPFMHDGRFNKISDVLSHYSNGVVASSTLSSKLKKNLNLSSNDKVDLISFLMTLSDKSFVFDNRFADPHRQSNR